MTLCCIIHTPTFAVQNCEYQSGKRDISTIIPLPSTTPRYAGWRLVTQANVIGTGELEVPVKRIRDAVRAQKNEYFTLKLHLHTLLKGKPGVKVLEVQFYPWDYGALSSPSIELVIASHRRKVLVFLYFSRESKRYFFAGDTPNALQSNKADIILRIHEEVWNQQRITAHFAQSAAAKPNSFDVKVKDIIAAMLSSSTQQKAFEELIALGPAAVPATIRLMDDRRPLGIERMLLRSRSSQAFEAYAQYGPQLIVDALSTIADYVSGENFCDLQNGGSEQERVSEIRAWRTYLFYRISWRKPFKTQN